MAGSSRRTTLQAAALLVTGAAAGAVLAVTVGASASAPNASSPPPATYAAGPGQPGPGSYGGPGRPGMMHDLSLTGTVRGVGSSSVTIETADGTKPYAVDADSDIDKNGDAKLSDLKAGDKVHFAVRPGTSTIAVLHAGDEAKNAPRFGPGGPCPGHDGHGGPGAPGPNSARPSPSPTSTT